MPSRVDAWRWALLKGYSSELPRWGVNVCGVVLQDVLRLQTHLHMLSHYGCGKGSDVTLRTLQTCAAMQHIRFLPGPSVRQSQLLVCLAGCTIQGPQATQQNSNNCCTHVQAAACSLYYSSGGKVLP